MIILLSVFIFYNTSCDKVWSECCQWRSNSTFVYSVITTETSLFLRLSLISLEITRKYRGGDQPISCSSSCCRRMGWGWRDNGGKTETVSLSRGWTVYYTYLTQNKLDTSAFYISLGLSSSKKLVHTCVFNNVAVERTSLSLSCDFKHAFPVAQLMRSSR